MSTCRHKHLLLLKAAEPRLRCTHCHLTIKPDDLDEDYCPECFERDGCRRRDFEPVEAEGVSITRYRCEQCGVIIEC